MPTLSRAALLGILALLVATSAHSDGIRNPISGNFVGVDGINSPVVVNNVVACSGTGLKFNLACNSQYVGLL